MSINWYFRGLSDEGAPSKVTVGVLAAAATRMPIVVVRFHPVAAGRWRRWRRVS